MEERKEVSDWIQCEDRLPDEQHIGSCTLSKPCEVILTDGSITEDWRINGKWVINCKDSGCAYPVKWRYKNE